MRTGTAAFPGGLVRTIEYLFGDDAALGLFMPAVVVACAISALSAALSVVVVLKRMSFIGQGVSHAAFGGVGLAAVLGLSYTGGVGGSWGFLAAVGVFCVLAATGMALMSARESESEDTAIAVVLVASMALGAVLLNSARGARVPSFEDVLFGSVLAVRWGDAMAAWGVALAVSAVLWLWRRPVLMWAFDEDAAPAFGVRATATRLLVMTMLAVSIVVSMKLAGVVLASALLVLPGASALRLSKKLAPVFAWAGAVSIAGVVGGLVTSFELDTPPGPTMVMTLVAIYALCAAWSALRARGGAAASGVKA